MTKKNTKNVFFNIYTVTTDIIKGCGDDHNYVYMVKT